MTDEITFAPAIINALDSTDSILLLGRAGSGKTTLLRHWYTSQSKEQRKTILMTASTGRAAQNLNANGLTAATVHSTLGLAGGVTADQAWRAGRNMKSKTIRQASTLVIDEISMIRSDFMDAIDQYWRAIRNEPDIPFGGLRLILVGDLHQLPPVCRKSEMNAFGYAADGKASAYKSEWFFDAPTIMPMLRTGRMRVVELDESHRQQDPEFTAALDDVRDMRWTTQVSAMFGQLVTPTVDPEAIILTANRKTAHAINLQHLVELEGREHTSVASLSDTILALEKEKRITDQDELDWPLARTVHWKTGMRVVFITNDTARRTPRWMNGMTGVIADTTGMDGKGSPVVETDDGRRIEVNPVTMTIDKPQAWYDKNDARYVPWSPKIGRITQLPFIPAYAMTIHRAQGLNLRKVRLELGSKPLFTAGQAYVSLSRTYEPEGLSLSRPLTRADIEGSNEEGIKWGLALRRFERELRLIQTKKNTTKTDHQTAE